MGGRRCTGATALVLVGLLLSYPVLLVERWPHPRAAAQQSLASAVRSGTSSPLAVHANKVLNTIEARYPGGGGAWKEAAVKGVADAGALRQPASIPPPPSISPPIGLAASVAAATAPAPGRAAGGGIRTAAQAAPGAAESSEATTTASTPGAGPSQTSPAPTTRSRGAAWPCTVLRPAGTWTPAPPPSSAQDRLVEAEHKMEVIWCAPSLPHT